MFLNIHRNSASLTLRAVTDPALDTRLIQLVAEAFDRALGNGRPLRNGQEVPPTLGPSEGGLASVVTRGHDVITEPCNMGGIFKGILPAMSVARHRVRREGVDNRAPHVERDRHRIAIASHTQAKALGFAFHLTAGFPEVSRWTAGAIPCAPGRQGRLMDVHVAVSTEVVPAGAGTADGRVIASLNRQVGLDISSHDEGLDECPSLHVATANRCQGNNRGTINHARTGVDDVRHVYIYADSKNSLHVTDRLGQRSIGMVIVCMLHTEGCPSGWGSVYGLAKMSPKQATVTWENGLTQRVRGGALYQILVVEEGSQEHSEARELLVRRGIIK